jgi:secondary thiamine-phosphate synthase enzyme
MKSHRETIMFHTKKKREYINITSQVEEIVKKSGVKEGLVLVNPMHITASCYINDAEQGLIEDFDEFLEKIAPYDLHKYRHHKTGEDNGDSHLKRQIFGREVVVAITNGKLDFGTWEQIFYAEFDGQRDKRVLVKVIGE